MTELPPATRDLKAMLDRLDGRVSKPSRIELLRLTNQFRLAWIEREQAHVDAAAKFSEWQDDCFSIIVAAVQCLKDGKPDYAQQSLQRLIDLKNAAAVAVATNVSGQA